MSVQFNHAIVAARDRHASASFFAHLFGLPSPTTWGPFVLVTLEAGVFLQVAEPGGDEIQMQHLAFLVDDGRFDEIHGRLREGGPIPRAPGLDRSTATTAGAASTSGTRRDTGSRS